MLNSFLRGDFRFCVSMSCLVTMTLMAGCFPAATKESGSTTTTQTSGKSDAGVFANAISNADPGEDVYLKAIQPALTALAQRDYPTFYSALSSHARASITPGQLVPLENPDQPSTALPLQNVSLEQFVQEMQKVEARFGPPRGVEHVYVSSIDPELLAGRGDPLESMMYLGAIPATISTAIRKAAVRAQIRCPYNEATLAEIADQLGVPPEKVQDGTATGLEDYDPAYFNSKLVLVEEDGQLKIGYFEFLGPSVLD